MTGSLDILVGKRVSLHPLLALIEVIYWVDHSGTRASSRCRPFPSRGRPFTGVLTRVNILPADK